LFTGFWTQVIVSVVELIGWSLYMADMPTFFVIWASIFGYWGSLVMYAVPWIFAALEIAITLKGKVTDAPGSYVLFILIVYLSLWILNGLLHLIYVPRLHAHVLAIEANEAAKQDNCPLKKDERMTDREYIRACQAIARVAKAKLAAENAGRDVELAADAEVEEGEKADAAEGGSSKW